ncbi:MAG: LysM peptidoglycan-binding domain-containing protein [Planktomarina sp.]|nr:LysM peptidoglycan-binding domain-containing protein [Planktomarina sp.]
MPESDNSEKKINVRQERVYSVIWAVLIGMGLIWWFYPNIRAALQTEPLTVVEVVGADLDFADEQEKKLNTSIGTMADDVASGDQNNKTDEVSETTLEKAKVVDGGSDSSKVINSDTSMAKRTEPSDIDRDVAEENESNKSDEPSEATVEKTEAQDSSVSALNNIDSGTSSAKGAGASSVKSSDIDQDVVVNQSAVEMEDAPIISQTTGLLAPTFDIVRIEVNGFSVISGKANGEGYVLLNLDGVSMPESRSDLDGSGEFVIFVELPPSASSQELRLELYPADIDERVMSDAVIFLKPRTPVFVAEKPIEDPETASVKGSEATFPNKIDSLEKTDTEIVPIISAEVQSPAIILADKQGVRVITSAGGHGPILAVVLDTISYNLDGSVRVGGRAVGTGFVRVYLDNQAITTSRIKPSGHWSADLVDIDVGIYTLRVDELNESGEVTSRAESPFKREDPADIAEILNSGPIVVEPQSAVFDKSPIDVQGQVNELSNLLGAFNDVQVSGIKAMGGDNLIGGAADFGAPAVRFRVQTVQPGSTLWAIAKERYGKGIEYFKVFEANKERIRDPDLIYPGQVFELPD